MQIFIKIAVFLEISTFSRPRILRKLFAIHLLFRESDPDHSSFNPLKFQRFVLPAEYNLIAFLIILITPMSSKRFPESLFSHRLSACRNNKTPTLSALRHAPPILGWY